MTRTQWRMLHAAQRLASVPFLLLEIFIRVFSLGFSTACPSAWWAYKSLKFCVELRKNGYK